MAPSRFGTFVTSAAVAAMLVPGTAYAAEPAPLTGTVETVIVDQPPGAEDHAGHDDQTRTFVRVQGRLLEVPDGALTGVASGTRATVRLRGSAVVSAEPAAGTRGARAVSAAGSHTLTVLPVFWNSTDAQTQESLTTLANQARDYWAEQSGGDVAVSVDVRDWKQMAAPTTSCNAAAIYNAALAAHATATPADPKNHVAVYFPRYSACTWAGLGSVNGPMMWINGYPIEDVFTHEFGHNLGLGHANWAKCTSASGARVPLSDNCTVGEYEDRTDVMGYGMSGVPSGNLNSAFGDYLGLQQTTTTSPAELTALSAHSGTSGLRIPVATGTIFVDYRPAAGRDTRVSRWAGVQVRLRSTGTPPTTRLLDMQPATATAFTAANLPAGATWPIPGTGKAVKVTATGDTTARVELVAGSTDTTAPSVAPVVTVPAAPARLESAPVSWTAAVDKESGVTGYRVTVNGATVAETDGSTRTAEVPLAEGRNAVAVVAVNGAGLVKAGAARTVVRDSTAPAAVTALKVAADGRSVTWTAPADTGTTRSYAVRIDGVLARTVTAAPASVSITAGRRTVSVTPSDAAGNTGAATETTLWVDPAAPVPPVITAPAAGAWQNTRQLTVTWNPASAPGSGIASYTVSVSGRTVATVDADTTTATVTAPADGSVAVTVLARNLAGTAARVASVTVKVDTVAPPAPVAVKLAADQSKLTWTAPGGTGSPVSWQVRIDDGRAVRPADRVARSGCWRRPDSVARPTAARPCRRAARSVHCGSLPAAAPAGSAMCGRLPGSVPPHAAPALKHSRTCTGSGPVAASFPDPADRVRRRRRSG